MTKLTEDLQSIVNAYCPTGEGGGLDNSCGPHREGDSESKDDPPKSSGTGDKKDPIQVGASVRRAINELAAGRHVHVKDKRTATAVLDRIREMIRFEDDPTRNESFFATCDRDDKGHCLPGDGSGGTIGKDQPSSTDTSKPEVVGEVDGQPVTAPPPASPDEPVLEPRVFHDKNGDGVTDIARVGVPAMEVPPPPPIPRLPNLTPEEREVERGFIDFYQKDPDAVAGQFLEVVNKTTAPGEPLTFGTDDAKCLSDVWVHPEINQRLENRSRLNAALHQTANAICKRAFLQHLDTLKPGDEIMVTVGGCGAGKGYSLGKGEDGQPFVPAAFEAKQRSKAVWDSAGDQNANENPWIQKEAEARGLKVNYVYVHADPENQWANPQMGVIARAAKPKDGRMVDADVFADSYAIGAKNHAAFAEQHKDNPNASFMYIQNGKTPKQLSGVPQSALALDRDQLASFAKKAVKEADVPERVKVGGTVGERIWKDAPVKNSYHDTLLLWNAHTNAVGVETDLELDMIEDYSDEDMEAWARGMEAADEEEFKRQDRILHVVEAFGLGMLGQKRQAEDGEQGSDPTENVNVEGCNQHTGPNCGGGEHLAAAKSAKDATKSVVKVAETFGEHPARQAKAITKISDRAYKLSKEADASDTSKGHSDAASSHRHAAEEHGQIARELSSRGLSEHPLTEAHAKAEMSHLSAAMVHDQKAKEKPEYQAKGSWVHGKKPTENENPDGCNQHTGPNCAGTTGEKVTARGERLEPATRGEDKVWRGADGKPLPEHIQKVGIPPGWKDVFANPDPNGDMLASGIDAKGRVQAKYSASHNARAAAAKFGRVTELRQKRAGIFKELEQDAKDPELRDRAECLRLVMQTGMRPGSDGDTKADYKSYGATTLQGRHVKIGKNGDVYLRLVTGKNKGREVSFPIRDKATAEMLKRRAAEVGPKGRMFNVSAEELRQYSKTKDGGGFKTKDHRTALGTETAIAAIDSQPTPTTKKEYKQAVKDVATQVAKTLGNTPSVALKAYIDPVVFAGWKKKAGI